MNEQLEATKKVISLGDVYPGYPAYADRLRLTKEVLALHDPIDLPDGPWEAGTHNRLPSREESERFVAAGYSIDSAGRPLHPWLHEMITDPNVGVVTGKGKYYNWGPNYTADPIVIVDTSPRKVLLIKRGDTGIWALPGGFVDNEETADIAAARELGEEARVFDLGTPTEVYRGVVADLRTTAHAWAETTAYVWHIPEVIESAQAGDDAKEVMWASEDNLPTTLHGSHAELIRLALEKEPAPAHPLEDILTLPSEELNVTQADGGHMAYDHLFIDSKNDHLFVKAHDSSKFTDEFREKHSKDYLVKEAYYFDYLHRVHFEGIPTRTELIRGETLAMDALRTKDGWKWRVPSDANERARYIKDILATFVNLGTQPIPDLNYQESINATYPTLWAEGWDDINEESLVAIEGKIRFLSASWNDKQQKDAQTLIDNLPNLLEKSHKFVKPTEFVLGHNDARQSNIAWHPDLGTKLVDWSWADPIPKNADATMFLIDITKSGYDVSEYLDSFDKDHALVLIGFLLAHSLWQTRDSDQTVRMQQVATAIAAHQLLVN